MVHHHKERGRAKKSESDKHVNIHETRVSRNLLQRNSSTTSLDTDFKEYKFILIKNDIIYV